MRDQNRTFSRSSSSASQSGTGPRAPSVEAIKIMGSLEEEETKRVKSDSGKAWLQGPHSLSRRSCRFELPMDMLDLELLSPLQYVSQFCRVHGRRRTLFRHYFTKNDRDRDGSINKRELQNALRDLYAQSINTEQVNAILDLLDVDKSVRTFDLDVFTAVAAFSERYLYHYYSLAVQDQSERRMVLEETDFCALRWKLEGCKISEKLKNLLDVL